MCAVGYWSCDLTKIKKRNFCKCCDTEITKEIKNLHEGLCFKCHKFKNEQLFQENILTE